MLTLDLTHAPRWIELIPGLRVQLRPLTTALMVAARADSALDLAAAAGDDMHADLLPAHDALQSTSPTGTAVRGTPGGWVLRNAIARPSGVASTATTPKVNDRMVPRVAPR